MTSLQEFQLWYPPPRCPDDPESTCDILLDDPLSAFQTPFLRPDHLCLHVAAYSTFSWAYERLRPMGEFADLAGTPLPDDVMAWPNTHPLPIGIVALQQRADEIGVPVPPTHVDMLAGLAEFDDLELAGLIISIRLPTAAVTFFGLAEPFSSERDTDVGDGFFGRDSLWAYGYPRPWNNMEYRYSGHRFTASGHNPWHDDVSTIHDQLLQWWNPFIGEPLRRGRRRGSVQQIMGEAVTREYWKWTAERGKPPTQDDPEFAALFFVQPRTLQRGLSKLSDKGFKWPPPPPE